MKLQKELPLVLVVALPFLYLAFIYNDLPAEVPLHWNGVGEIDDWGSKNVLWIIPILLPVLTYILMSVIPKLDPKGKIKLMGSKFYQLKFILILFMSALALYILYASQTQALDTLKGIFFLMGILFAAIGNYMPSLKPNYFIGLRTPWTLENETVWKKTHRLTGKLWLLGGLCVMILTLIINQEHMLITLLSITGILTIVPLIYSYLTFKKEEQMNQ